MYRYYVFKSKIKCDRHSVIEYLSMFHENAVEILLKLESEADEKYDCGGSNNVSIFTDDKQYVEVWR